MTNKKYILKIEVSVYEGENDMKDSIRLQCSVYATDELAAVNLAKKIHADALASIAER